MTVLRRNEAPGLSPSAKRTVSAMVLVVIGIAAAFGISRLVDDDRSAAIEQGFDSSVAARYAENLTRIGQAQIAAVTAGSAGMTLQEELAAIQARTGVVQSAAGVSAALTPAQELAAIQARTGVTQTVSHGLTLEQELAAIQARTGVAQTTSTDAGVTLREELAAIHARTGVVQPGAPSPERANAQLGPR